ncbi:DUF2861 family protein [Vibrio aphrogenes]|uniref:DUF2861 family protein n=1 Tax=Vibrio aphrogenes TaxID=1891186 RepID=UPI000B35B1F8|nr:DUF2861 family protein [Vibrio aphrogenes]
MKFNFLFVTASLLAAQTWAANTNWFYEQTALSNAHKFLLEGELNQSFDSMVQVWQKAPQNHIKDHLDQLLLKSLDKDCGRSFDQSPFPTWLDKLAIQRQVIQSPGRVNYRLEIDAQSKVELSEFEFIRWPDNILMSNTNIVSSEQETYWQYSQRSDLNAQLESGLYKIKLTTEAGQEWESWVLLAHPNHKQTVRWNSKDSWVVDKTALLNKFCPLPVMNVALYGNLDGGYKEAWTQSYESDYPTTVPNTTLPANRYLLGVSITHKRWQGEIAIEDKQVINKAYDITEE